MASIRTAVLLIAALAVSATVQAHDGWQLDETPAGAGEWGFRPADGAESQVTPPGFVWRPQDKAGRYQLQVSGDKDFQAVAYEAEGLELYAHCPSRALAPGTWYWRFRAYDRAARPSAWSATRSFIVRPGAAEMPLPGRAELKSRVPREHPRLFLRPEHLPRLRELAKTTLADRYRALVARCERLLKEPPPTAEPKEYPPNMERRGEAWRELWWGNRVYTIQVLESAATLAFVHRLDGNEQYAQLARRLLMDAARWNPKGATGYRYNDEAGMPYAYHFSRAYTLLHDVLTEEERRRCREVMRIRGREMYDHLRPGHIWRPYNSHANRAWHFLGEVGIAFLDEIPEAEEWMWFSMNVFCCSYPVWSDDDGGWHEGLSYWRSYIARFTWWADVMRSAFGIDAYQKPYFAQIGFYPLYLQPPGTSGGGFGDLCGRLKSGGNVDLLEVFAAQTGNPYWQWYVEAHDRPEPAADYIDFLRGALPKVTARPPTDLPTSRLFQGTGQAVLNSHLLDARQNVELIFKSSLFGTQSHGYDANNAFILYAFGSPLFISSGWRDMYGSDHHKNWMWHTRSTNSITIDGQGQRAHTADAVGQITRFATTAGFDYVRGEAGPAYAPKRLSRFSRGILFVKPDLIVIHDHLESGEPARFEWWLHSPAPMRIGENQRVLAGSGEASCRVTFLAPDGLKLTQTDQFDPPPRPRVKLTEYHLTAATPSSHRATEFITVLRPFRTGTSVVDQQRLIAIEGGWAIEADLTDGKAMILLQRLPGAALQHGGITSGAEVAAFRFDPDGKLLEKLEVDGNATRQAR